MHRVCRCIGLVLLSAAFVVPTWTVAQDKKADEPKQETKKSTAKEIKGKKEKPKPDWSAEYAGKLTAFDDKDSKLVFTVQINYKLPELNVDIVKQIDQQNTTLAQQQLQYARAKTPQERNNIATQMVNTARQIEKLQAQIYKVKDVNFDIKCQAADKMRVRKYEPVQQVDPDSGEFIKMTKERILEAKGYEGYPGYQADNKILKTGQNVIIYISKDSKGPGYLPDKSKKDNRKVDDIQNDLKNYRFDVIMIYVATEAPKGQ
ncbi:MAG TPA: hypothetical protein VE988_29805 [Gemmataceae bacterium]|nr:hypothetical protein [Gemmataceae bacterium]